MKIAKLLFFVLIVGFSHGAQAKNYSECSVMTEHQKRVFKNYMWMARAVLTGHQEKNAMDEADLIESGIPHGIAELIVQLMNPIFGSNTYRSLIRSFDYQINSYYCPEDAVFLNSWFSAR